MKFLIELLPQALLNGVVSGAVYGLIAVGLSMIFSIMRMVNMAHGEFYMVGAYVTWAVVTQLTGNYWLAFLLTAAVGAGLGYFLERVLFRPIYGKPLLNQFILSLGLLIILQEIVFMVVGGKTKAVPAAYSAVRHFGSVYVTDQRLIVVGVSVALIVGIILFLRKTKTGKAMRATAGNRLAAGMVGIDINRVSSLAFVIGIALATMAGALLAPIFALTPFMGERMTGLAFVIVVTGGMGSVGGAILASFLIGMVESLFCTFVSIEWTFAVAFVIMIIVLMVRPLGFFGRD